MYLRDHENACIELGAHARMTGGAGASPEHDAATLHGMEQRVQLQSAQSVASRDDGLQSELCNQAKVAGEVDPKRVNDRVPEATRHIKVTIGVTFLSLALGIFQNQNWGALSFFDVRAKMNQKPEHQR